MAPRGQPPRSRAPTPPRRGHEVSDHTADAGIHAWAAALPELFEELAAGLAELQAEVAGEVSPSWAPVELGARDLEGLAFAWLNELIATAEIERRAIVATEVLELEPGDEDGAGGAWRLCARVGLVGYEPGRVGSLRHVKAATMHGLRAQECDDGWSLDAVVDI